MRRTIANLAVVVCVAAIAVSGNRTLADHAFVRVIGDWEQSDGGKSLEQHFRFANDLAAYGLTYTIAIPDGTPPGKCTSRVWAFKTKDVTLGMSAPVGANWYTQAFSSVRIDGLSLHDIPGTFRIVRADGDDALVEGLWDTPKGPFSMRLLLRAGDDKLLVQYVLPSENSDKRLDVRLMAYPHGFQKPWDRHTATAVLALMPYVVERLIIEPETHKCTPGEVPQFVVRLSLGGTSPSGASLPACGGD